MYSQIFLWQSRFSRNSKIRNGFVLSESIVNKPRTPRVRDQDRKWRVGGWASRRESEIHPVGRMQVFGARPDCAHLHLFGPVDERLGCAAGVKVSGLQWKKRNGDLYLT